MGAMFNGECYATAANAVDAYFLGMAPTIFPMGYKTVRESYEGGGGSWSLVRTEFNGSTWSTANTVALVNPTFPGCDVPMTREDSFADGQVLGWGVVAALVFAWAISVLRKGL